MKNTYHKSEKAGAILDILKLIGEKPKGWNIGEIAAELGITEATCRNYVELLTSRGFVEKYDGMFVIGNDAARIWSSRKAILDKRSADISRDYNAIGA